jgi:hypothetical protein
VLARSSRAPSAGAVTGVALVGEEIGSMTELRFVTERSSFLEPCKEAIQKHRDDLDAGRTVRFSFDSAGGYKRHDTITIDSRDQNYFASDRDYNDPTRFSARLSAAATALRDLGYTGRFELSHDDGEVTIKRA